MHETATLQDSPIVRGIKTVGIGKRGSKPLNSGLIKEILQDLTQGRVNAVQKAAFFAALMEKGITEEERELEKVFSGPVFNNPLQLAQELCPEAPEFVQKICAEILSGNSLNRETAFRLGKFLFSDESGDSARALVASYLRVRYETADEYEGLLRAMNATIEKPFCEKVPAGAPIIQLAEPFDGVDHSYLITPLIADYIQTLGFRVVLLVGRNSGPKFGNNLSDLASRIDATFAKSNQDLGVKKPDFGWYIHQKDLSKAVDRWVEIRHQTIKRPFLSTLERFMNPVNAKIHIASAFHPPYTEKMMTICERMGFPAAIIVRNGLEGTLSTFLNRSLKLFCSMRSCVDEYTHQEFSIDPGQISQKEIRVDENISNPSLEENARLVQNYKKTGQSGSELFDLRVKVTCESVKKAIEWVSPRIEEQ